MNLTRATDHRLWPLPRLPWIMKQTWHDLLFAHWPVPLDALRPHIPPPLPLDTYEGQAWIAVVPFRMSGVRLRATPPVPGLSAFEELNVRTYVTLKDKPGVFFFSLDAACLAAVIGARLSYHLPYFYAHMLLEHQNGEIRYASRRRDPLGFPARLLGGYRPTGEPFHAAPGTLEHWLTERYCLYIARKGYIYRGEIHHLPWPLQPAEAEFEVNTMALAQGIDLPVTEPLLHFARYLEVIFWPLYKVTGTAAQ